MDNSIVYDASKHSKSKLGAGYMALMVPAIPIAAQVYGPNIQIKVSPEGAYVSIPVRAPVFGPGMQKAIKAAMITAPEHVTYSGSGRMYKMLVPVADVEGKLYRLHIGTETGPVLAWVVVNPLMDLISTDEPIAQQTGEHEGADDADPDDDDAEPGPSMPH